MPLVSIYLSVTFGFWALAKSKFNDACRLNQRLILLLLLLSFLFVRRNNNNYPRRIRTPLGDGARIFEPFECDKILALAQTCQITSESSSKRYTRKVSSTFWRKFTTHTKFHSNYCFCSFLCQNLRFYIFTKVSEFKSNFTGHNKNHKATWGINYLKLDFFH